MTTMSNKWYTSTQATAACRANGTTLAALAARYRAATGRSLYMGNEESLRIDRDTLIVAIKAWNLENRVQLTPYDTAQLVTAAYAIHSALHSIDEAKAYDFALAMGIVGDPEPDAIVAERMIARATQSDK